MKISGAINDIQKEYNSLCDKGGGVGGGPNIQSVYDLIKHAGRKLNNLGHQEITRHLESFPGHNPWHICFAMGLCWGHLAKDELTYMEAALGALDNLNQVDLNTAKSHHYERGSEPVEKSLIGGHQMFADVLLPDTIPNDLNKLRRVQERWLSRILIKSKPKPSYIGSWNATAMFLVAIFSMPKLWDEFIDQIVLMPPNGPVYRALSYLKSGNVIKNKPAGSELDDSAFEPGALYENNSIMAELITPTSGLNMIDVHSGLYMLGTKYRHSNQWA